ncbi:DUF6460 domain-containing protein [Jiella sp. MQZ9-1]|uniref:DUF6460 domain-containing protein n=1 Tax=Jiella flava TaxID=2816857 RepID=A0A939FZA3_9HYPH|nr:DUF6460 domain-containing protein [Jiella flava]MBO0662267.1 hypothetical protein [Jiella flava]MCD2470902.1 DUF6460 domain-containing protein [Jiella flava]
MSDSIHRFLGGSPIGVAVRLILISILVGFILSWLHWNPHDIIQWVVRTIQWAWHSLFGSVEKAVYYFLLGAAIVVPVFIISRVLKMGRR